jgi:hypothetical protein
MGSSPSATIFLPFLRLLSFAASCPRISSRSISAMLRQKRPGSLGEMLSVTARASITSPSRECHLNESVVEVTTRHGPRCHSRRFVLAFAPDPPLEVFSCVLGLDCFQRAGQVGVGCRARLAGKRPKSDLGHGALRVVAGIAARNAVVRFVADRIVLPLDSAVRKTAGRPAAEVRRRKIAVVARPGEQIKCLGARQVPPIPPLFRPAAILAQGDPNCVFSRSKAFDAPTALAHLPAWGWPITGRSAPHAHRQSHCA